MIRPRVFVTRSKSECDDVECMRNFASACHVPNMNRRSSMTFSHDGGNNPSKHGIAHCN